MKIMNNTMMEQLRPIIEKANAEMNVTKMTMSTKDEKNMMTTINSFLNQIIDILSKNVFKRNTSRLETTEFTNIHNLPKRQEGGGNKKHKKIGNKKLNNTKKRIN